MDKYQVFVLSIWQGQTNKKGVTLEMREGDESSFVGGRNDHVARQQRNRQCPRHQPSEPHINEEAFIELVWIFLVRLLFRAE